MHDIIHLLPDHISNQIAAGEVIQRPASAVKELLENAIDAQATKITLILKEAGKTLIQVQDNGIGMSKTDARMCFEKHATSKIQTIDDLFRIQSKGFRGEALASIAAVSQVELKTKRAQDEIGTCIQIEDSCVQMQEPAAIVSGTQVSMKNLFYNVPARRNFLKSDAQEMTHILAEFSRLAIAYPEIEFSLFHNGIELYRLLASSPLKRITDVMGRAYNEKLIPISEESDIIKIHGYVCKPMAANSKTKGKQYLYVNKRFIKSPYIQHAISSSYKELIREGDFPFYVIFIELDPKLIDINVHPTKQEIKFEDEQLIYGFVHASIRRSLVQYNIAPSLDFSIDRVFNDFEPVANPMSAEKHKIEIDNSSSVQNGRAGFSFVKQNEQNWQKIFSQSLEKEYFTGEIETLKHRQELPLTPSSNIELLEPAQRLYSHYICAPTNHGVWIIDQRRAHERVLFDELLRISLRESIPCQRLLFPMTVEFSIQDSFVMEDLLSDLHHLGFDISPMGNQIFAIQGIPADLELGGEREMLIELVENFKNNYRAKQSKKETILISICKVSSVKRNQRLSNEEVTYLIEKLLESENYHTTPSGKPIYYPITHTELDRFFTNL